jgi:long-subunit acyl-CoA synthetase (AMP-forming)
MRIALPYPTVEATQHWADWLQRYAPLQQIAHPQSADTMTICYTSGSTGVPKGVVLSYLNIASSAQCTVNRSDVRPQDRMLSYLPLAHITERAVVEMVSIWNGVEVYFVESMETFAADLRHARPTGFVSVPRLWTIFQAQILQGIPNATLQRLLRIPLLNKLVARRIRKAMGIDKARRFGSGTAPISPAVLEWFQRIGVPIGEGWGMTETAGLACGNVPFQARHLGTIGLPVDCVEMRLGEHGELLVRGDSVFKEYYLNPEATAAAFSDGWFHTGDRAIALEDGAWKIVGRLKEQFKTAKGKYVAPVPIESLVASDPLVEQVCVMGSGRKQPVAFVVLNNSAGSDREAIRQRLNGLLGQVNSQLESHECLDHIVVCADGWSVENELLTPTMKLKRDQIETRYARLLEPLAGSDTILWEDGIT